MPTAVNQFWLYSFPHCPDAKSGGSMFCQIGSHLERGSASECRVEQVGCPGGSGKPGIGSHLVPSGVRWCCQFYVRDGQKPLPCVTCPAQIHPSSPLFEEKLLVLCKARRFAWNPAGGHGADGEQVDIQENSERTPEKNFI